MTNKKILSGALVILGFAMIFTGCENVQQVEIVYNKAAAPANVGVQIISGNVALTFDAVENATTYSYYRKVKGSKILTTLPTPTVTYTGANDVYTVTFNTSGMTLGTTYEFGVQTAVTIVAAMEKSDVVWAELTYSSSYP
ncbi:MAG: hypothetical protein LBR99_05805 [Treponema sp.]|jgi:hypothetical protein|nr:hypothetical protein [Treponema sp.]